MLEQRRAHSTRARRGGWRRTRGWKPQPSSAGSRDVPLASHRNLQPATRHTTLPASQEAASSASHRGPAVSVDSRESGVLGQRTADSGQRTDEAEVEAEERPGAALGTRQRHVILCLHTSSITRPGSSWFGHLIYLASHDTVPRSVYRAVSGIEPCSSVQCSMCIHVHTVRHSIVCT